MEKQNYYVTLEYLGFLNRMACAGRKFFVGAGLLVTDQAVNLGGV